MLTIEEKLINILGGEEKIGKKFLELTILGEYTFNDSHYDINYGTYYVKSLFGTKKYLFLNGGEKNYLDIIGFNENTPIPAVEITKLNEEQISRYIDQIKNIGEKILPKEIEIEKKVAEIINNTPNLKLAGYRLPIIVFHEFHDGSTKFMCWNSEIKIFSKDTFEEKEMDTTNFIKYWS